MTIRPGHMIYASKLADGHFAPYLVWGVYESKDNSLAALDLVAISEGDHYPDDSYCHFEPDGEVITLTRGGFLNFSHIRTLPFSSGYIRSDEFFSNPERIPESMWSEWCYARACALFWDPGRYEPEQDFALANDLKRSGIIMPISVQEVRAIARDRSREYAYPHTPDVPDFSNADFVLDLERVTLPLPWDLIIDSADRGYLYGSSNIDHIPRSELIENGNLFWKNFAQAINVVRGEPARVTTFFAKFSNNSQPLLDTNFAQILAHGRRGDERRVVVPYTLLQSIVAESDTTLTSCLQIKNKILDFWNRCNEEVFVFPQDATNPDSPKFAFMSLDRFEEINQRLGLVATCVVQPSSSSSLATPSSVELSNIETISVHEDNSYDALLSVINALRHARQAQRLIAIELQKIANSDIPDDTTVYVWTDPQDIALLDAMNDAAQGFESDDIGETWEHVLDEGGQYYFSDLVDAFMQVVDFPDSIVVVSNCDETPLFLMTSDQRVPELYQRVFTSLVP